MLDVVNIPALASDDALDNRSVLQYGNQTVASLQQSPLSSQTVRLTGYWKETCFYSAFLGQAIGRFKLQNRTIIG
jgi:hypothetical protein